MADELRVSKRTLYRYMKILREEFTDESGAAIVEEVRRGDTLLLRLSSHGKALDSTAYQLAFFYFALTVFDFLDGTVLKEGVEGLWERLRKGMPQTQTLKLADFPKKFFSIPVAPKDYHDFDDVLDEVVPALVFQRRLRIDYGGMGGEGKEHLFDPYTLTMYRGGLYLIGHSDRAGKPITLAVERIRSAVRTADHFDYPKSYSPQKYTDGAFGLINQPDKRTGVEVLIRNEPTAVYLRSRRLHPSQKLRKRSDGLWVLSLTVHGTDELRNWVLGFGPHLEVLAPAALREEVRALHAEAAANYGRDPARSSSPSPTPGG